MPESVMIKNAYVYYAKLKTPALKYKKEAVEDKPFMNKEYVAEFLLTAAQMKALKKEWKTVRAFKETTEVSEKELREKYKVEDIPSDEYKNEDGKFEMIKFRKHASQKDGTPNDPPKLFGYFKSKGLDKAGKVITQETLLGNGTLVNAQLTVRKLNTASGKDMQLDLFGVQVVELVPYETKTDAFEDHEDEFEESDKDDSEGFDDHDEETEDDDFS